MVAIWVVLVLIFRIANTENLKNEPYDYKKTYSYADLLTDTLKFQQWDGNEEACLNSMLDILDNAKNFTLWAVWILDSHQHPMGQLYGQKYHLGNYDECIRPYRGFQVGPGVPTTHYCVADVALTETEEKVTPVDYVWTEHNVTTDVYLRKLNKYGRRFSKMLWGLCVPDVCQPSSAAKIFKSIFQVNHLGALSGSANINVTHCLNDTSSTSDLTGLEIFKRYEMDLMTMKAIQIRRLTCADAEEAATNCTAVFSPKTSTYNHLLKINMDDEQVALFLVLVITTVICTYYVKNNTTSGSFVGEVARAFCLNRNINSLTSVRDEEVFSMNFMRVLSCVTIVVNHYILLLWIHFFVDALDYDHMFDNYGYILSHLDIVVDTFLVLSGLLYTRGIFNDPSQNPLKHLWKRYIRLVAGLVPLIFFVVTMSGQGGSGPVWHEVLAEQKVCVENWFYNLLMMGNIMGLDKLCITSTWYVPCDFQLCMFATMMFLIYKNNKPIGTYALAVAFVFSNIIPGLLTYLNQYPILLCDGVVSLIETRNNAMFENVYIQSYSRAGPFIVGMAMGYIMYTYKPKDYRNIIGKLPSFLAVIISVIVMLVDFSLGHYYYFVNEPFAGAIYASVNRTVWGIAICVVIAVSEYGDVPLLNSIFSWSPLVPISRLTYGVYLIHIPILGTAVFSLRTNYGTNVLSMAMGTAGLLVLSMTASLLVWLLVEAPLININNVLLDKTWKNKAAKCQEESNNTQKKVL